MSRFVVLRHETGRGLHWDLMLERDGVLWTWAMPHEWRSRESVVAQRLADHRLAYLEYEGPLSGHRGTVTRCDGGFVEWLHESPDRIEVQLTLGGRHGRLSLMRLDAETGQWQIQFAVEV